MSASTFSNKFSHNTETQTELFDANVCAFLSTTMEMTNFKINCFHCKEVFPLWDWSNFVLHMQDTHFDDNVSIPIVRRDTEEIPLIINAAEQVQETIKMESGDTFFITSEFLPEDDNNTKTEIVLSEAVLKDSTEWQKTDVAAQKIPNTNEIRQTPKKENETHVPGNFDSQTNVFDASETGSSLMYQSEDTTSSTSACEFVNMQKQLFQCVHCGRFFNRLNNMKRHVKAKHEKVRMPFVCNDCGKSYARLCDFEHHQRKHGTPKTVKTCSYCGKVFARREYLTRHERALHRNIRQPFVCEICNRSYKRLNDLENHKNKHFKASKKTADIGELLQENNTDAADA